MTPRRPSLCVQSVVSFPDGYSILGWQLCWDSVETCCWGMNRLAMWRTRQTSRLLVEINPSGVVLSWMDPSYSEWQKGRDHVKTVCSVSAPDLISRWDLDGCKSVRQSSYVSAIPEVMSGTILFSGLPTSWFVVIKFSMNYTLLRFSGHCLNNQSHPHLYFINNFIGSNSTFSAPACSTSHSCWQLSSQWFGTTLHDKTVLNMPLPKINDNRFLCYIHKFRLSVLRIFV